MEAKTVRHAYFAGRSATGLPEGGHGAILEIVHRTPFKKLSTGKVHPEELSTEEMPEPEFRLKKLQHTLAVCDYVLESAEELHFFGFERVIGLPAEESSQRIIVYAFFSGLLLPSVPYEDCLEVETLAAVLKAGVVQRSEAVNVSQRDAPRPQCHLQAY